MQNTIYFDKEVTVPNLNFVLGSNPNEHRMEIEKEIVFLL